jgi:hypothetical protein
MNRAETELLYASEFFFNNHKVILRCANMLDSKEIISPDTFWDKNEILGSP